VSYQTEERYWTDYVRVATPIVGLLLLLGVFWYWASSLIGNDSGSPPPTQPPANVTVVVAPSPTPTATTEITIEAETAVPTATEAAIETTPTEETQTRPTRTPTEQAAEPTQAVEPGNFAEGEVVLSADNQVNMRSQPSVSADVVEVLSLDQALTVINGQPQEGDGLVWWNVRDEDNGNEGWVDEEWLKKQE
jgi:cytoskeletal protein RodZ